MNELTLSDNVSTQLHDALLGIKSVREWWGGHVLTDFVYMTPDELGFINSRMLEAVEMIIDFYAACDELGTTLGAHNRSGIDSLEDFQFVMAASLEMFICIEDSYCLSAKYPKTESLRQTLRAWQPGPFGKEEQFLKVVQVKPWEMPPCPALMIPEQPAVILSVLERRKKRIDVGLLDIFGSQCLASNLHVEEPVKSGDLVVIRATSWDGQNELVEPKYDGLACRGAQQSIIGDIMSLSYDFDFHSELAKHEETHETKWLRKHWPLDKGHSHDAWLAYEQENIALEKSLRLEKQHKEFVKWYNPKSRFDKQVYLLQLEHRLDCREELTKSESEWYDSYHSTVWSELEEDATAYALSNTWETDSDGNPDTTSEAFQKAYDEYIADVANDGAK